MPSLARGQTASPLNPVLDIYTVQNGALVDVAVLEFQIWNTIGTPSQVYPVTPGDREVLDPEVDSPTGPRMELGHYAATWTPGLAEPIGAHEIRWFFRMGVGDPEQTWTEPFSVLAQVTASPIDGYATVAQVRLEGSIPSSGIGAVSDARIVAQIELASRMIDRYTRRWFNPRPMTMRLDGDGRRGIMIGPPIISISGITILGVDTDTVRPIDASSYRVYNRHLSGLLDPDDRQNPMIELTSVDARYEHGLIESSFEIYRWPEGTQNLEISGVFGYTEADGSPTGRTPLLITRACVLLTLRMLAPASDPDAVDARNAWRLLELRTRDQTIKWADPSRIGGGQGVGVFTGDPEIDNILLLFCAPPAMGAA